MPQTSYKREREREQKREIGLLIWLFQLYYQSQIYRLESNPCHTTIQLGDKLSENNSFRLDYLQWNPMATTAFAYWLYEFGN